MTINTIDDLLRVLREDEDVRAAVRRELLTEELLALPDRFAKYAEVTDQRFEDISDRLAGLDDRVAGLDDRVAGVDRRVTRLDRDFGRFRGQYARDTVERNAVSIVIKLDEARTLGIDENTVKVLSRDHLQALAKAYGPDKVAAIPRGDRGSYYETDLAIDVQKYDGSVCYIAVQASFTCDDRDTTRAATNAGLLRRFTGKDAWAVIAGVRVDRRIQHIIDSGEVFFYQMEDRDVQPDEPD